MGYCIDQIIRFINQFKDGYKDRIKEKPFFDAVGEMK